MSRPMPSAKFESSLAGRFLKTATMPIAIRANGRKLVQQARFEHRESMGLVPGKSIHKVAILGFGTVGSAVARIFAERSLNSVQLTHIYNRDVVRKKVDWLPADVQWTDDFNAVLSAEVDIFVELIGGLSPAGDW